MFFQIAEMEETSDLVISETVPPRDEAQIQNSNVAEEPNDFAISETVPTRDESQTQKSKVVEEKPNQTVNMLPTPNTAIKYF